MDNPQATARKVIDRCRLIAACSEESGATTRTFLSPPMHDVHAMLREWMRAAGLEVGVDAVGNIRGVRSAGGAARRLYIGSHLDTVARAGAFDGILGVVIGVALVEMLMKRLNCDLEIIGFSEEEGMRFGAPFIGSRAFAGTIDDALLSRRDAAGATVAEAIRAFGLDPSCVAEATAPPDALGYIEFHIEQGPVLEALGLPLAVVDAIVGQSRYQVVFDGQANHAGTTPMDLRRDALAGAAEWIGAVERAARAVPGLAATVGHLEVVPNVANAVAGSARASLDVRHSDDAVRHAQAAQMIDDAREIASRRGLTVSVSAILDQAAVAMDGTLASKLARSVAAKGHEPHLMPSGAGHDAMIVAQRMPVAMLFLRSPGGISHDPSETVLEEDVAAALEVGLHFLENFQED